jgi:tetratricopeptide (TPR) repeat protein
MLARADEKLKAARVDLEYRFENLNPYPWGLAAWIDTMHLKKMSTQFILPTPWVAGHGFNIHRTTLYPWPVRGGIDLSWQKNIPPKGDLSEFGFMPREHFHGCYDYDKDRGAVRVFDPATLPAAKIWTQAPPVTPDQYYQHFEIWTATSAVMEDPLRQAELSAYEASDSWQQVWGIGGYVFANRDLALNLVRRDGGKLLAGVCAARHVPGCVVGLREGPDTFLREAFDLDPARPWRKEIAAPAGDIVMEVTGPDGACLARYELRSDEVPQEEWKMPPKPRWAEGLSNAYYEEDYSTLWRRPGHFMDGAIRRYKDLLQKDPESSRLMADLARAHLKDEQVRLAAQYPKPGAEAEADATKQRAADLEQAISLFREALKRDASNARAHLYLGLALERQGKPEEAVAEYRAALRCPSPAWAADLYLARRLLRERPAEAADSARRAAVMYPQSTAAGHLLMAALVAAGKPGEAVPFGRRLLEIDPADPVTTQLLADAFVKGGNDAEAEAMAKETRRLLGDDAKAKDGWEADLRWLGAR